VKILTVVGDALLDRDVVGAVDRVCPDAPVPVLAVDGDHVRPGGAALAAVLARRGRVDRVQLITALGDDAAGRELAGLLTGLGIELIDLGTIGATAEKIRVRAANQSIVRIDRGGSTSEPGPWTPAAQEALGRSSAVLVSDYGRGMAAAGDGRDAIAAVATTTPVVWDPHPRGPAPVGGCRLVTPNQAEAAQSTGSNPSPSGSNRIGRAAADATELRTAWEVGAVAVTLGAAGAVLVDGAGTPLAVPAAPAGGDPCGAGDCFAAIAATELAAGALVSEAVTTAVAAASAFVADGGAGGLDLTVPDAPSGAVPDAPSGAVPETATAAGRSTVGQRPPRPSTPGLTVAAGGCFDLLHAGHIAMLQAARALGDRLVVLLNSDDSVRRLKGPSRPLQPAEDRAAVLLALDCVDDVVVFDEQTPREALERLRPDLFVKGGDYAVADLPEAKAMAAWGGTAVTVPYLSGRSTSRLVTEAARRSPTGSLAKE
jgi:rfaE bifunctional protein nucleotidyltransferase chain/domain/rfaE bifunctional protein kinase chain/domain